MKSPLSLVSCSFGNRRSWIKTVGLGLVGTVLPRRMLASGKKGKKAIQLHIYIETKPGMDQELERLYRKAYVPAIKVQKGFRWTRLLRHYESSSVYEIDISFRNEEQRAAWAASKEHQDAWPKIEAVSSKITWQGFDELA